MVRSLLLTASFPPAVGGIETLLYQTSRRPALNAATTWRPSVVQAAHIYLAPLAWLLARRLTLPFVVYAYGQEVWRGGRAMGLSPLDGRLRGKSLEAAD